MSGISSSENKKKIIEASRNGNLREVQRLLNMEISPNVVDEEGQTPLHEAAYGGHPEVVSLLLAGGAQIEAVNKVRRMVGRWAIDGGGIA